MENKVRNLIEGELNKINIKLDNVEYIKENGMYYLRITIDKEPFVDVDTCVLATKTINPLIDTLEDEFDDAYILDVCSKEKGDK